MSKTIYEVIKDIQDFFKYRKPLHLSFGRKIVPTYVVNPVPLMKEPEVVQQALTQNTWYTVCDLSNVEIADINVVQSTANEDLELRITDDVGVSTVISWTAVAGTEYAIYRYANVTGAVGARYGQGTTLFSTYGFPMVKSRVFKVEIRKTTAAGANATNVRVNYAQW